jgi:2-iminoacetate synthase
MRLLNEVLHKWIASTRIGLGAYSESDGHQVEDEQQFMLGDNRSLEQLIADMADKGHITSFCTAGYRIGRTGEKIMRLLRECHEGSFCKLNAIITFREWLDDFASPAVKEKCEAILAREMKEAEETLPEFMKSFKPMYKKTCNGNRDYTSNEYTICV